MQSIRKVLNKESYTFDELINCLEDIKNEGDVVIIKLDGEREDNQNTIMITFPNSNREIIRHDGSDLKKSIQKALLDYISVI